VQQNLTVFIAAAPSFGSLFQTNGLAAGAPIVGPFPVRV
jgi:hypothetical protein